MRRNVIFFSVMLSLAACQGDNSDVGGGGETGGPTSEDPCQECAPGGYAVDCGYLWGLGEFTVCGIDQSNAEYLCDSTWAGVVISPPSDNCVYPGEPWAPALDIYNDPSGSRVTIIEADFLERIETQPQDIYLDDTRLEWSDDGEVFVSTSGELAHALSLREGDVLIDINGYSFVEMLDTVRLYFTLRDSEKLTLTLERQGTRMTHRYRIE